MIRNICCYNSLIKPFINHNNNIIRLYAKKSKKASIEEREQNEVQLNDSTRAIKFNRKIDEDEKIDSSNNNSGSSRTSGINNNSNNNKYNKRINNNNYNNNNNNNSNNKKWYTDSKNKNQINHNSNNNNNNNKQYKNKNKNKNNNKQYNNKLNNNQKYNREEYYKVEEQVEEEVEEDLDNQVEEEYLDNELEDKKIKSLKEINQIKREETIISHLTPIIEVFKKRKQDIVKLVVDHQFYNNNKKDIHPIIKYLTDTKRVYKILNSTEDSNEKLTKMSGTIHHGGIMAVVKRKYAIPMDLLIENEIDRVKVFQNTPVPTHSFSQHIKIQQLKKQKDIETLGSAARPIIVFLDGVENPMNLGAIARTCALFGVKSIIINNSHSKDPSSLNPFSGEAYRSSRGALEHVNISILNSHQDSIACLNQFISNGWELVVTTSNDNNNNVRNAVTLYSKGSNKLLGLKPMIMVFGSESSGITKPIIKLSTRSLTIPGTGLIESLNVAQAASVILAECWRIQGKTLESPNESRIESIKSGNGPLEITPQLLGINESDIYNDNNNNNNNDNNNDSVYDEEDYSDSYQEDSQYKR